MQNKIKTFVLYFIGLFLFNGCFHSQAPITCLEISNNYAKYDYIKKPIILNATDGYEELAKYIFFYDSIYKFNEDIDTYFLYLELFKIKAIKNSTINKYCKNIDYTIKNSTNKNISEKFRKIKKKWTADYGNKINIVLKNRIEFNTIDNCYYFASKLMKYISTYNVNGNNMNIEVYKKMKNNYEKCLSTSIKKRTK